jgi:hypothetical protein
MSKLKIEIYSDLIARGATSETADGGGTVLLGASFAPEICGKRRFDPPVLVVDIGLRQDVPTTSTSIPCFLRSSTAKFAPLCKQRNISPTSCQWIGLRASR